MTSRGQGEEREEFGDAVSEAFGSEDSEMGQPLTRGPGNPAPMGSTQGTPPTSTAPTGSGEADASSAPLTNPLCPDLTTMEGLTSIRNVVQRAVAARGVSGPSVASPPQPTAIAAPSTTTENSSKTPPNPANASPGLNVLGSVTPSTATNTQGLQGGGYFQAGTQGAPQPPATTVKFDNSSYGQLPAGVSNGLQINPVGQVGSWNQPRSQPSVPSWNQRPGYQTPATYASTTPAASRRPMTAIALYGGYMIADVPNAQGIGFPNVFYQATPRPRSAGFEYSTTGSTQQANWNAATSGVQNQHAASTELMKIEHVLPPSGAPSQGKYRNTAGQNATSQIHYYGGTSGQGAYGSTAGQTPTGQVAYYG